MTNTRNHGGERKGSGRNKLPKGEAKIYVVIGIPENDVNDYGGIETIKADCIKMVKERIKK